ncbi:MAG: branched-chain amino acid ABC transporter permease [Haloferacaceae archaeon]
MALSSSVVTLGIFVGIYALLALGLNLKFGYSGLLDIGHVAFFLVGAYTSALLVAPPPSTQQFANYILGLGWTWLPAIAVGTFVAGVFGMLVALPAIRLREDYLAITLLGVSVIVQRVIQVEGWLANGPGTLRGYSVPLSAHFPLPSAEPFVLSLFGVEIVSLPGELVLGTVVLAVWTLVVGALSLVGDLRTARTARARVVNAVFGVLTLGVGFLAARRAQARGRPAVHAFAAALPVAALAAVTAAAGLGTSAVFVFFGLPSLFTWVFGAVALADHYASLSRRDALVAVGLALAFVAAFAPLVVLGGGSGTSSTVGFLGTVVLLVAFLYGIYALASRWDRLGSDDETGFVSVVGIGAVVLFVLRYFVLALIQPFKSGGVAGAASNLLQNLLWLMRFESVTVDPARFLAGTVVTVGYSRFLLVTILATVGAVYVALETAVTSPFGRVLKAIREDESVATALGKNTFAYKIETMILGSAVAGLAGALWAIYTTSLVFSMFAPRVTFFALLMVIVGGTANNRGVILGSVIYWAFERGTSDIAGFFPTAARTSIQALRLAFIGALLIVILYYRPEGIWGERHMVTGSDGGE